MKNGFRAQTVWIMKELIRKLRDEVLVPFQPIKFIG